VTTVLAGHPDKQSSISDDSIVFLFSKTAVGSAQVLIQWAPRVFFPGTRETAMHIWWPASI